MEYLLVVRFYVGCFVYIVLFNLYNSLERGGRVYGVYFLDEETEV